ncbi:hypothetical protein XENORESO_012270 [Xenotaenia resolanae]|uniref:Uncharacterized protein n=1 Tax=Xenotaenia resolanae TaxID=208358 RepID=A0ABV0WQU2_9TELE
MKLKKSKEEEVQSRSEEERNQNGVSEGMCKLGQTLLRLLLLLLFSPPPPPPAAALLLFLLSSSSSSSQMKQTRRTQLFNCNCCSGGWLKWWPGSRLRAPACLSPCLGVSLAL